MYLFLLEPQNIIIQDHDQGQEKESESQVWIAGNGTTSSIFIVYVEMCIRYKFILLVLLICVIPGEKWIVKVHW